MIPYLFFADESDGDTLLFAGSRAEMTWLGESLKAFGSASLGEARMLNTAAGSNPRQSGVDE